MEPPVQSAFLSLRLLALVLLSANITILNVKDKRLPLRSQPKL
jgi:hypothetical protein